MKKKSFWKKLLFIILISIIIRLFFFEIYLIPSNSMNNALLTGDIILVSKFHYGARINGKKQRPKRLPGISKIKRNDIIVFNYPRTDTVYSQKPHISFTEMVERKGRKKAMSDTIENGGIVALPITYRQAYIKRCITLPGEKLQLINHYTYINDTLIPAPSGAITPRSVKSRGMLIHDFIPTEKRIGASYTTNNYLLKKYEKRYKGVFPNYPSFNWVGHFYGPLIIPKKGDTLTITIHNLPLYRRIIETYEANILKRKDSTVYINNDVKDKYIVQQNYYFMLGDNRNGSLDSRFWGYLPEDHIIGKAICVLCSFNKNEPGLRKIRWNRFFKGLNE